MTILQKLFGLIKSLSGNEKRHFRINTNPKNKPKNYQILLDKLIELSENESIIEFNQNLIKKKCKKYAFAQKADTLRATEKYLYQRLMEDLRNSEKNSVDITIRNLMSNAEILLKRGLYEQSLDSLNQAEQLAHKHQRLFYLLDILPQKAQNTIAYQPKFLEKDLEKLYQEARNRCQQVTDEMELRCLNHRLLTTFRKWRQPKQAGVRSKMDALYEDFTKRKLPDNSSFFSWHYYYCIHQKYHHTSQNYIQALDYGKQLMELWDAPQHKDIYEANGSLYIAQLTNYINSCTSANKLDKIPPLLERMKAVPALSKDTEGEKWQNYYYCTQLYWLNKKNFKEAQKLIPEIKRVLEEYASKINRSRKVSFYYNNAVSLFLTEQYEKSNEWLERIQSITRTNEHRKDVRSFVRILRLVIYYMLPNTDVLDFMLRNVAREQRKSGIMQFEKTVLAFFRKLINAATLKEAHPLFIKLQVELSKLDATNKNALGYEEFCIWVDRMCKRLQ